MQKVSPALRFLITAGIFVLYILSLVQWALFDGLLRHFFSAILAFVIAFVIGVLCAGITYGVLPTKTIVEKSVSAYKNATYQKAVIGYWTWVFIWAIFYCIWMFIRIYDL